MLLDEFFVCEVLRRLLAIILHLVRKKGSWGQDSLLSTDGMVMSVANSPSKMLLEALD